MSIIQDIMWYKATKAKFLRDYVSRVKADGGTIYDTSATYIQRLLDDNAKYGSDLKLCNNPLAGTKIRTSGVYNFATKSYDISGVKNDATQTTATNQPYLSKIAPIEKPALLNPNGGSNYMTHPTISFGASDAWSVEVVLNWNGTNDATQAFIGNYIVGGSAIFYRAGGNRFGYNNGITGFNSTNNPNGSSVIIGKQTVLCFVANGDKTLNVYINGLLFETLSNNIETNMIFTNFMAGRAYVSSCKFYHYAIFSKALSASEVANRAALLRAIYPEIESVPIGTQTWAVRNFDAVCTPQGNLIPEVQAASNTEKITNAADREFSSDTGWWTKSGGSVVISGGACNFISSPQGSYILKGGLTLNKWFKITYDVLNYSSGIVRYSFGANVNGTSRNANGTYSEYLYCSAGGGIYFEVIGAGTNSLSIDNVSVQEVSWSDSQNLYDYVYANTAGTIEEKTYAAVKAAAMWCHYNNDPANGAIYSKLYNWFAVKLLQMDIDYYNAANPTTPWGWRVPTQADFTTLQTYLGGASVAGGKLKMIGTGYWNSPNIGATNETGFSALGSGRRFTDGSFTALNAVTWFWVSDQNVVYFLQYNTNIILNNFDNKIIGNPIRLIKQ